MNFPIEIDLKYEVGKKLGEGGFATVWRIKHRRTGRYRALKIIRKSNYADSLQWKRELQVLTLLQHPNIVRYYEYFETEIQLFIVLEYCEKDLFELVAEKGCLSEDEAKLIAVQILSALNYCHSKLIAHRDIKLENVLIKRGVAKLTDFGFARFVDGKSRSWVGSALYSPVEIILHQEYRPLLSDAWSFGVLLATMVYGGFPFQCKTDQEYLRFVEKNKHCGLRGLRFNIHRKEVSLEFRLLIAKFLEDVDKRLTLDRAHKEKWFQGTPYIPLRIPLVKITDFDIELFDAIVQLGFDREKVDSALRKNKSNSMPYILYCLLLERKSERPAFERRDSLPLLRPKLALRTNSLDQLKETSSPPPMLRKRKPK